MLDLVEYIQKEREKDPNFKRLVPSENSALTHEQILRIVQNDVKYLKKVGLRMGKAWIYDNKIGTYNIQPDIEK
jgi:hypothetical protein